MMRAAATLGFLCFVSLGIAYPQEATPPIPAPGGPAAPAAPASAPGSAAPSAPAKPDLSLPKDTTTQWQIGICVFSSEGLSADNTYLAYSLPLLLKDQLSGLRTHTYQEEEKELVREALIAQAIADTEKAITATRKERDALFFNAVASGTAAWTQVEARLSAEKTRLDFLRALPPVRVEVATEKPVAIKEGSGAGKLLETPRVPPAVYCAQQGLDLLIGGSIQEVQGYLLLDIWAFDRLTAIKVLSSRNSAVRDELYAAVEEDRNELARTILGRPWSLVAFTPDPPDTALSVDGHLVASGASPSLYLSPGIHQMALSATGYREVSRTLTLVEEKEMRIDDRLEKLVPGEIAVSSNPPGADLYVDSFWMGKTPVQVERPPQRSRGVLSLPGFYDKVFSLGAASPDVLSFSLEKDLGPRDVKQTRARDQFYVSLAFFALSLPVPLFFYAMSYDYALKSIDLGIQGFPAAAAQAHSTSTVFQGIYYGGVALSVALFAWMVTRIVHYVRVADEIAG